ncbi:MAG TPA: hypothetical protein VFD46_09670 [Chryseolinea sp.]|nr:hypothetical protein [Chryseolinea sp.]
MSYFLALLFVFYFLFTLNFAIKFNKVDSTFIENQKLIHNVLIWLIPFFWIIILNTVVTPTLGSTKNGKAKSKNGFSESGIGIWTDHDGGHHHHHTDESFGHDQGD